MKQTFEEQFPELKGYNCTLKESKKRFKNIESEILAKGLGQSIGGGGTLLPDFNCWEFVPTHSIQKHCRSVQRIKEAIEKTRKLMGFYQPVLSQLEKELEIE